MKSQQALMQSPLPQLSDIDKWNAVLARDETMDGEFVTAVRTTGIYCRPSCPAKHPYRTNVVFYAGPSEAEQAGFRPCKRCNPRENLSARSELVQRICQYINSNLDEKLTLANLSQQAGLSPFHLQRTFKRVLGISPRQYIETRRLEKLKRSLNRGETVTSALYDAGFTSRSRLYEGPQSQLGVHPGLFRRGGEGLQIRYTIVDSPVGRLLLGATQNGVCAVCMGASDEAVEAALREDYYAADAQRDDASMKDWVGHFSRYFEGHEFPRNLPIDVQATAFQWKVWKHIEAVPYGQTTSYTRIAEQIGKPRAVRAVANACANNHVALIVPCHRIVGNKGELRGYRWGVKRKQAIISMERNS
jgi:AraC family transcriptional regulator, regulatory protein of adaptative response / methylated-DNA-[protein]-cysteine methyltransferase